MTRTIGLILLLIVGCADLRAQPGIRDAHLTADDSAFIRKHEHIRGLIQKGSLEEAERHLGHVTAGGNSNFTRAVAHTSLGALSLSKGRNDLAVDYLEQAMTLWDKSGMMQTLPAAETLSYLGNLYRASGKWQQAEEILSLVLLTRQQKLPPRHELIAAALNDLGLVFITSDPDRALEFYEQALDIYEAHKDQPEKIAIARTNIAFLYGQQGHFEKAITNLESAAALWDDLFKGPHAGKAFVLFGLGSMAEKMNDLESAGRYYANSLEAYIHLYGSRHPDVARSRNALGNIDRSQGNFDGALRHFQKAVIANHPEFDSGDITNTPSVRAFYDGNVLLYTLMYKAQALEQRYLRKSLRPKDLRLALHTLQSCDSLIHILRNQITSESDKLTLGAVAQEVYSDGVRISMQLAQEAFDKGPWYELAFFFAERNKAAVLLGALSDANAKAFSGIPASVLEKERQLKSAIALCSQQLAMKPGNSQEQSLRESFYNLSRIHKAFTDTLEMRYPAYFNLKYSATPPSTSTLRQSLPKATMVISYFIDEKNSTLYIFTLTHDRFAVTEKQLPEEFHRYITGLRNSIYYSEAAIFAETSARLSKLLLPRIPGGVQDLVLVPTLQLNTIPFETLLISRPGKPDFGQFNYVIRRYSVRYEFSCALISQPRKKPVTNPSSILLFAPVLFSGQGIPDLPGTENEVREIAAAFDSRVLPSRTLMFDSARKEFLKNAELNRYAYLHFATHGVMNETNPDLSGILMNGSVDSDRNMLFASEIYNLNLNCDLVTLSACETGLGKISKGEGVIGLSRALIYAGARACMVSLWKVPDEATAILMKRYYAKLIDSPDRNHSATLQQTKIHMMRDTMHNAPYYWASFVLIGY